MPIKYNEVIKQPNIEQEWTEEQVKEIIKCSNNPFEFFKHIKIVHGDKGRIPFEPFNFQTELINKIENNGNIICMAARQSGKSVVVGAYALYFSSFNKDKVVGIGSNKMESAKSLLAKIKLMYEELPYWLKPGIISYAKTHVHFDNGSKIIVSSTSPDSFRGETINLLILDEFALVDCAEEFWASNYPTLSSMKSAKVVIISTPNGMFDLFHKLWTDAENKKNSFITHFAPWYERPDRDEEWKNKQIKDIGKIRFASEFECKFLGSTSTVIDSNVLSVLMNKYEEPKFIENDDCFRIWEKPIKGAQYILGCDVSEGLKQDNSVVQILKVERYKPAKFKQVAVFSSNEIDTFTFAGIINKISYYYNEAFILIENNSIGNATVNELIYNYENFNLINNTGKKHGICATQTTKTKAVLTMKKLIENGDLELIDEQTIDELCSFIEKNGKYFGENINDDHVSALYWACFVLSFPDYFENGELKMNKAKDDDEEVWGFLTQVDTQKENWNWL